MEKGFEQVQSLGLELNLPGKSDWCANVTSHFNETLINEDLYGMTTYSSYLSHMEDPTVYATSLDVFMMSQFLQANIVIYSSSEHPNREFSGVFGRTFYLYYNSALMHYEPIVQL